MDRWFAIHSNYYNLAHITHFEATRDYNQKYFIIKGYQAFPVTWSDDHNPSIRTQSYVVIGGNDNNFYSQDEAELAIIQIIRGDYDVEVKPPLPPVKRYKPKREYNTEMQKDSTGDLQQ